MAVKLPATLQTCVGMVQNGGRPQLRAIPRVFADLEPVLYSLYRNEQPHLRRARYVKAAAYIRSEHGVLPEPPKPEDHEYLDWTANLAACKTEVTTEHLKSYMRLCTRLDLEQAAAVVISAFVTAGRADDAGRLFEETFEILRTSCMWIDPEEPLHHRRVELKGVENISRKLHISAAKQGINIPLITSISELVPLLMRVRRSKPNDRCLIIPQWMFEEAQITPPPHFQTTFNSLDRPENPSAPPPDDAIPVSKHHFNVYQRKIFGLFQFWIPSINLRRRIRSLADNVLYGSSYLDSRVFNTNDVALLCHYFFAFQRRLQRKVISTKSGDEFLAKGEGRKLYQNNLRIKSTFETVLETIVDSSSEGVIVAMGPDNTLNLIDQTCRLMREYVHVHGAGSTANLTYKRDRIGGGGRGPVDDYSFLCDVLEVLRQQARDEGNPDVPGPTFKFLAKDIMDRNNGWGDDAFAGGRKAGWEAWLERREGVGSGDEEWEVVEE